jgi:thymidylate synthase ThyX
MNIKKDRVHPTFTGLGFISAKVIESSLHPSEEGKPLITIQLRYPRFIHSELMTHRVFSRNASSSRAIPVPRMLQQVREEPAMPIHWGKNQPGMQAFEELDPETAESVRALWIEAAQRAVNVATAMSALGAHKQVVNRILEPFQFISVIVTATEWDNFFALRDHPAAQPEIRELARVMKLAIDGSRPNVLNYGEWHLPYVSQTERVYYNVDSCLKLSTARCARVSYLNHDGTEPSPEKDFELFDRLVGSEPLHASPIEHQATPDRFDCPDHPGDWANRQLWGNFKTWVQHRKVYEASLLH